MYKGFTGGVLALSAEHVHLINGFSNHYFGWGGEDDDVYNRSVYVNSCHWVNTFNNNHDLLKPFLFFIMFIAVLLDPLTVGAAYIRVFIFY